MKNQGGKSDDLKHIFTIYLWKIVMLYAAHQVSLKAWEICI